MKAFIFVSVLVGITALAVACNGGGVGSVEPSINCSKNGDHGVFVAIFDSETVGSLPAPSTLYGPPDASLNVQAAPDTIEVVDSAELGSRALWITRPPSKPANIVDAVLGKLDGVPNDAGIYYIEFEAHGEVVPLDLIAGMEISVVSAEDRRALSLKLFDGSYHLLEGGSANGLPATSQLIGTYDPGMAHSIHVELNLDTQKFSMCVNDEAVVENKAFLDDDFTNFHLLEFWAPATILEAFGMEFVVDEIRITK